MKAWTGLLVAIGLSACGGADDREAAEPDDAPAAGVFNAQVEVLDSANEVEELNRRKKEAVDEALRQAGEGDPR